MVTISKKSWGCGHDDLLFYGIICELFIKLIKCLVTVLLRNIFKFQKRIIFLYIILQLYLGITFAPILKIIFQGCTIYYIFKLK